MEDLKLIFGTAGALGALGALIGVAVSASVGYLTQKRLLSHEDRKDARARFYHLQDQKRIACVDFLARSQGLIQSYLYVTASPDADDYKDYLRSFNDLQILFDDNVRLAAFHVMSSVSFFIFSQSRNDKVEAKAAEARELISQLQFVAREELSLPFDCKD